MFQVNRTPKTHGLKSIPVHALFAGMEVGIFMSTQPAIFCKRLYWSGYFSARPLGVRSRDGCRWTLTDFFRPLVFLSLPSPYTYILLHTQRGTVYINRQYIMFYM